eukprot:382983-Rhodomonas_salina.2
MPGTDNKEDAATRPPDPEPGLPEICDTVSLGVQSLPTPSDPLLPRDAPAGRRDASESVGLPPTWAVVHCGSGGVYGTTVGLVEVDRATGELRYGPMRAVRDARY